MTAALGLTALSAVLYGASFPPWSLAPLAWIALAPLLVAVVRLPPGRAACCGVVWGVVAAYTVGWWFPHMVASYFERPLWLGWVAFFTVSVALAGGYFAAFAAWVSWLARRGGAGPLAVAVAWGACELARSRLWVGNPWALSGYSQVKFAAVMQLADVAGPYGIGMLIAAVNAVVAGTLVRSLRGTRWLVSALVVGTALAATLAYGSFRLGQDFATGRPIRVAVVQGAVERGLSWKPEYRRFGLEQYLTLTEQAAAARPQLVLWPEYAISFYLQESTVERDRLFAGLGTSDADLILGGPSYQLAPTGTQYRNSVFLVRDAAVIARYDKVQLLPLAEQNALVRPLDVSYTAGAGPKPLRTRVATVGAFLCSESMYPELVRSAVAAGADLLAVLSNEGWLGAIAPAQHHLEIDAMRAIEGRRYLLRAASTGPSAILDPHGRILQRSDFGKPAVLNAVVYGAVAKSPYQGWGWLVAWVVGGGVALLSVRCSFRRPA